MSQRFIWIVLICAMFAAPLVAQTPSDPIKCWWKTDKSAVIVGEQFTLTLTCGVIETRGTTVVPKMEELDPGAMQLAPFEMVGGTRHEDIQAPPWRYFQYDYTLRLMGQDSFGQDVDIPSFTVTYNMKSDVPGAGAGRDHMYVLPALPMRIQSLVPKKANDIRDAAPESFAAATVRLSRSRSEFIAAGVFFGFSVLMLIFAGVHVIRRHRGRGPERVPVVSDTKLVGACIQEISRLQSEVKTAGWTPERAGSALTVLRIGSAVAMGRPVSQTPMETTAAAREGQIAVRKGILGRERIAVSAAITPVVIEHHGVNGNAMIADLGKSLFAFNAVRYGRNGNVDTPALNRALENSRAALQRLRLRSWKWKRSIGF
jgi:hypothetical protein